MAENSDKRPNLQNQTVSEYLYLEAQLAAWRAQRAAYTGAASTTLTEPGIVAVGLPRIQTDINFAPRKGNLGQPKGSVQIKKGPGGLESLRIHGRWGPFGAYYSESGPGGKGGAKQGGRGADITVGGQGSPSATIYGQQATSRQRAPIDPRLVSDFSTRYMDQKTGTIGVRGSWPTPEHKLWALGKGALTGDISRQFTTFEGPQHIRQKERPTGHGPPVTNIRAGWKGKLGPGELALQAALNKRGGDTTPAFSGSYTWKNPFGLDGNLAATGSYVNPRVGKSATKVGVNYTVPLDRLYRFFR